jgi:hypothetical protein
LILGYVSKLAGIIGSPRPKLATAINKETVRFSSSHGLAKDLTFHSKKHQDARKSLQEEAPCLPYEIPQGHSLS